MVDPNFYIVAFNHVLDLNSRTQFLDKLSVAKLLENYHKQHSLTDKLESTFAELRSKSETCTDLSQEIQYHLEIAQKVRLLYCTIIFCRSRFCSSRVLVLVEALTRRKVMKLHK